MTIIIIIVVGVDVSTGPQWEISTFLPPNEVLCYYQTSNYFRLTWTFRRLRSFAHSRLAFALHRNSTRKTSKSILHHKNNLLLCDDERHSHFMKIGKFIFQPVESQVESCIKGNIYTFIYLRWKGKEKTFNLPHQCFIAISSLSMM